MGWTKVCGTTRWGIWVLKGNARARMLPENLHHLRVGWLLGIIQERLGYARARLSVFTQVWTSSTQSDHKLITPSGMELLVCGGRGRTLLITLVW